MNTTKKLPHAGKRGAGLGAATCALEHSPSIPQRMAVVKREALYQPNMIELLDHALAQIRHHRARWLATGDNEDWRLMLAYEQDRLDLLAQVGGEDHVA